MAADSLTICGFQQRGCVSCPHYTSRAHWRGIMAAHCGHSDPGWGASPVWLVDDMPEERLWRDSHGQVEGCSPEVACIIHNSRSRTCRLAPPNLWGSESSVMSKQTGTAVVPDWIWGMKEDSQVSDLESEVDIWGIHWEREDGICQGKADRPNNYKSFSAWKYNHFIGSFLLSREELEINCLLARVYSLQRMC